MHITAVVTICCLALCDFQLFCSTFNLHCVAATFCELTLKKHVSHVFSFVILIIFLICNRFKNKNLIILLQLIFQYVLFSTKISVLLYKIYQIRPPKENLIIYLFIIHTILLLNYKRNKRIRKYLKKIKKYFGLCYCKLQALKIIKTSNLDLFFSA